MDNIGTPVLNLSSFCPGTLQGDKVENGKIVQSYLCLVFVLAICRSNEDKSGTILRPMMTKTSPDQDKTENLKTETRHKWDKGQKWDKCETKVGQK